MESTGSGGRIDPAWQFAAAPGSLLFREAHVTCGGEVLIVGDSHILLCGAHQAFPLYDVSARVGRESTEGLEVVEVALRPHHTVVVFDLASNDVLDPLTLERNLGLLWERIGPRELVLVNTWRADFRNLHLRVNRVLQSFVDQHPDRVALIDWAAYIDEHPAPFGADPDYVHFTTEVYRDRIVVLSEAIDRALDRADGRRRG